MWKKILKEYFSFNAQLTEQYKRNVDRESGRESSTRTVDYSKSTQFPKEKPKIELFIFSVPMLQIQAPNTAKSEFLIARQTGVIKCRRLLRKIKKCYK